MSKLNVEARKRWVAFFPDHLLAEVTVLLAVALVLITATQFMAYPLEEMANPAETPMGAKPPWYFYFLYQLLKYFPPLLAAVAIPTAGVVLLFVLPFIDRNPERALLKRKVAVPMGIVLVVALVGLTYLASLPYAFE